MTENTKRLIANNDNITIDVHINSKTCHIKIEYDDNDVPGVRTSYISQAKYDELWDEIDSMLDWLAYNGEINS